MPKDDADPFVVFILSQPGMVEALLALHHDDGTGHCAVCVIGGQHGRQTWPCRTSGAAEAAARYRTNRAGTALRTAGGELPGRIA